MELAIVPRRIRNHCDISHSCENLFPCYAGRIFVPTAGNLPPFMASVVGERPSSQCPLVAISRHPDGHAGESALPSKADIQIMIPGQAPADVRFTPNSGHK